MRTIFWLVFAVAFASATADETACAQSNAVYLTTYIELMPTAVASGVALLKRYREASRKEEGNLRLDVLGEIARNNRFVIIEAWSDKGALEADARSPGTLQFDDSVKQIEDAPVDRRVGHALYLEQSANVRRAGTIYVVTHIDVIPPGTAACIAALRTMGADTPKDRGNISYDVLEQADHANHFTVLEEWADRKAADAHAMAAHTRAFRDKLKPIAGALYDERLYTALH